MGAVAWYCGNKMRKGKIVLKVSQLRSTICISICHLVKMEQSAVVMASFGRCVTGDI